MLKVLKYLKREQWLLIAAAVVFIVIQVWLDLLLPDYLSVVTELAQDPDSDMGELLVQGGLMLLCALGSGVASICTGYCCARTAAGLSQTLRDEMYNHTLDFSLAQIGKFSTASLTTRTTNDITQVQNTIAMGMQAIIKAPITFVWAVCKIIGKSWQWSVGTIAVVAVLVVVMTIVLVYVVPRFAAMQGITDDLNRIAREQLTGIRVVRAYDAEQYQEDKFNVTNDEYMKVGLQTGNATALINPMMLTSSSALTLVIYWIGAGLIEAAALGDARMTLFTDMVVFSNYAMQIIMAFMMLNMVCVMLPRAQVSAQRITEVIDTPLSIFDGAGEATAERVDAEAKPGTVEFRDVSFAYPGAAANALTDINVKVEPGKTLAIIGATGSGKTTFANLIPRLYDVEQGQVLVDGVDVREYTQRELRDRIGYVQQKAVLFSGTVRSNVAFGDEAAEADTAHVQRSVDIAQATEFVDRMDGKLDAAITQGGGNVSGGQRQRLSIARAINRDAEILIFDDSFSALDYKTDAVLRQTLNEECAEATKIIVAQRIGTIRDADQIIVLEHGRIVGAGTHAELMQTCETYQEIALSQLSKEELA